MLSTSRRRSCSLTRSCSATRGICAVCWLFTRFSGKGPYPTVRALALGSSRTRERQACLHPCVSPVSGHLVQEPRQRISAQARYPRPGTVTPRAGARALRETTYVRCYRSTTTGERGRTLSADGAQYIIQLVGRDRLDQVMIEPRFLRA